MRLLIASLVALVLVATPAKALDINFHYDDGKTGFGYGFGSMPGKGDSTVGYASSNFWSEVGQVTGLSLAVYHRYEWDPITGEEISGPRDARIELSFGGIKVPATAAVPGSGGELNVNDPPVNLYESAYFSTQKKGDDGGKGIAVQYQLNAPSTIAPPPTPDIFTSYGSLYIEGNFSIDGTGYGSYFTFPDYDKPYLDFNASMNVPILLPLGASVSDYPALTIGEPIKSAAVPEPASLSFLVLAAGLFVRRAFH